MAFQASDSIFNTNAVGNEHALRIEALRLAVQLGGYVNEVQMVGRAEKFYKFMLNGTVPTAEAPPNNA